jgi:hypothetical protein
LSAPTPLFGVSGVPAATILQGSLSEGKTGSAGGHLHFLASQSGVYAENLIRDA